MKIQLNYKNAFDNIMLEKKNIATLLSLINLENFKNAGPTAAKLVELMSYGCRQIYSYLLSRLKYLPVHSTVKY